MKDLVSRIKELKKIIETVESTLVKMKLDRRMNEEYGEGFERNVEAMNLGLETFKAELGEALSKLRSITDENVNPQQAFHFYIDIGRPLNISAISLKDFLKKLESVPKESLEFHSRRGDFSKWIRNVIGDAKLAKELKNSSEREGGLRGNLIETISFRLEDYRKVLDQTEISEMGHAV